jgi:hypothetical protein
VHPAEVVLELSTFDGRSVFVRPAVFDGWQEYVGWVPSDEERRSIEAEAPFLGTAVAPPRESDDAHLRYKLRCPRASCRLDHQMVSAELRRLQDAVRALWAEDVPAFRASVSRPWASLG